MNAAPTTFCHERARQDFVCQEHAGKELNFKGYFIGYTSHTFSLSLVLLIAILSPALLKNSNFLSQP